ncbi:family 10 glycosylhydrolase [Reichenbachiella agariperforans]|uniref:family 10 glycosylhydrolase n=1 Tax=Reichenbachiella agariperforans TaxID=156994 RepID=UPI001C0A3CB8|nr:family 10 glycosylhydrolase [Reichenbachiella agariperforans]
MKKHACFRQSITQYSLCTIAILLLMMCSLEASWGQTYKAEYRAVWVASVSNLDWPSSANRTNMEAQKQELIDILDSAAAWNLNAIFLQIRPQSDAFYESALAPWSEYVSGARGTSPGYDPLAFAIEEGHKRGIEIHGWLNPYRYETSLGKNDGKPGDYNADHPEWMLRYETSRIFNPGVPEVMEHLKDVVGEIVNNYDIDGIHFDDYFYPYSGTSNEDQATYETYGGDFDDIGDWRRDNVNTMIGMVKDTIESLKPYVRFGISPFGIHGNGENPEGISGLDAYNAIYTDAEQWLSSGNIDYVCPQLYWPTGGAQDFATLLPWWAELAYENDRHVMAGHGIYRYANNPDVSARGRATIHEDKKYFDVDDPNGRTLADPWTLEQISTQIDIVRDNRDINALGGCFFRYQDFIRVNGIKDQIVENHYQDVALMPSMTWKTSETLTAPANLHWDEDESGIYFLSWDEGNSADRYVLYASSTDSPTEAFFEDPANILRVVYGDYYYIEDGDMNSDVRPYLFMSTYDRYGNESTERSMIEVDAPVGVPTLASPEDESTSQPTDFDFEWTSVPNTQSYLLELSLSEDFAQIDLTQTVSGTSFNATGIELLGDTQYYWRVSPVNFAGTGSASVVYSFSTGFPSIPSIVSPVTGSDLIPLKPLFEWSQDDLVTGVTLEIARGGSQFESYNVVFTETLGGVSEYQMTEELDEWTTYHLRLKVFNDLGESIWVYSSFKTLIVLPEPSVIYSPLMQSNLLEGDVLEVEWSKSDLAKGYKVTISSDAEMSTVIDTFESFSVNDTTTSFSGLMGGDYYVSVQGKNVGGYGQPAQVSISIDKILGVYDDLSDEIAPAMQAIYSMSGDVKVVFRDADVSVSNLELYNVLGRRLSIPDLNYDASNAPVLRLEGQMPGALILILRTDSTYERIKVLIR